MKALHVLILLSVFSASLFAGAHFGNAQSIDDLNKKLDDQKSKIEALNREIEQKQKELQKIGGEKTSLQAALNTLEVSRKKLQTEISKTETQIGSAETTLKKLSLEINDLDKQELGAKDAISYSLKSIAINNNESLIEVFLFGGTIMDVWNEVEESNKISDALEKRIDEINTIQGKLEEKHDATEKQKQSLLSLKKNLSGQKISVEVTSKEKNSILTQTKNKEAEYQKILALKQAQKTAFEKALFEIENQLKIALDPDSYASAKNSILSWPLDNVRITQYFGRTADAKRLYVSGTHNGVDFGVPDGTPLKAALSGTVTATGNTDNGTCYSYGKWVLLKHDNGLSTLYAHMSSITAKTGDSVRTGEVIGYSGRTGYATGPHLHFTVYATQGVRVQQYTNSINCKSVTIPIADPKAYLDPMVYLPSL